MDVSNIPNKSMLEYIEFCNQQSISKFEKWLADWIEITDQSNQCPYAKPTLKSNKLKTIKLENVDNAYEFWLAVAAAADNFQNDYDVSIIGMDTNDNIINQVQLLGGCDSFNAYLNFQKKDLWALTLFSDVYTLVLLQSITKLDDARKVLEKKGHYKNYHPYQYNKDVILRKQLRDNLDE